MERKASGSCWFSDKGLLMYCTKCKIDKPESKFYFKNRETGKRDTQCKQCVNTYRKNHYEKNKQVYVDRAAKSNKKAKERNMLLVLKYLRNHPCVDCGESDPIVLDFDHRDPDEKEYHIHRLLTHSSWSVIMKEIEKCDVRCANCHRRRTALQFGWMKLRLMER